LSSHLLETQMAEAIQQLILTTLDRDGGIKDTRQLILPGESTPAASQDAQLLIIAALNSLTFAKRMRV
jgi:phenylalanyl-tRNA synthetase alpha chain